MPASFLPLFGQHELPYRTQYAELKERTLATRRLLPGSPGHLALRTGTGRGYWYRVYYPVPGSRAAEEFVGAEADAAAYEAAQQQIGFADWAAHRVRELRALQFQVADKAAGRVLVELHNSGLLPGGLVVVGTLAFMSWLNELGVRAVASRTQDIDLARRQSLKLAAPQSFLDTVRATTLPFAPIPSLSAGEPSTSVKLPGAEGLRLDLLAHGARLGRIVEVPELNWHAQTVPHFDYLLRDPLPAALLAGGHCVPVSLPAPERLVWHKVYSSVSRVGFREKAQKDLLQAATLAAVLVEHEDARLADALRQAPSALRSAARARWSALRRLLEAHPQTIEEIAPALTA